MNTVKYALVVDDDFYIREMIKKVLENLGYEIIQAENGQQAVELFEEHQSLISLITMDNFMPLLKGGDAINKIREKNKKIPIIGISSSLRDMKARVKSHENFSTLEKPIDEFELKMLILEIEQM